MAQAEERQRSIKAELTQAEEQQKKIERELNQRKVELAESTQQLSDKRSEIQRAKTQMTDLVQLANAEEWEGAVRKLIDLLSEYGLRFDATALSKLAKLNEEDEATEEAASDEEIARTQIRTFANASLKNLELVQQWLSNNGVEMPIAFFLRSKNLDLQKKMIRELKMPIAEPEPPLPLERNAVPNSGGETEAERNLPTKAIRSIQENLCVQPSGIMDSPTRDAIRQAKLGSAISRGTAPRRFSNIERKIVSSVELQMFLDSGSCNNDEEGVDRGYRTAFEKFAFADESRLKDLHVTLAKCDSRLAGISAGKFDSGTRNAIRLVKRRAGLPDPDTSTLDGESWKLVQAICL
jgi:hypothetical protein